MRFSCIPDLLWSSPDSWLLNIYHINNVSQVYITWATRVDNQELPFLRFISNNWWIAFLKIIVEAIVIVISFFIVDHLIVKICGGISCTLSGSCMKCSKLRSSQPKVISDEWNIGFLTGCIQLKLLAITTFRAMASFSHFVR